MNKKNILAFLVTLFLSFLLVVNLGKIDRFHFPSVAQSNQPIDLTISAAASLQDALKAIKPIYEKNHPEVGITYNFGSSGSLQQQIEQGAPVDLFISAAIDKMDALEKQGLLLTATRRDLLKNQMVLVTPASNQKNNPKLDNFDDLTTKEITTIALGEPKSVPAGKYGQEVLNYFKIADRVNSQAVYAKDVRQVLNYVATGNVDAAIIYRTDAQVSDRVQIVATAPETSHSPVIYPVAVIQDSSNPETATEFVEFLTTLEAQAVFEEYGFVPVVSY
ncbi:MAG: molybdate ABC transporter substrate-binding protein [Xenococcaceae cyanobacterium]